MNKFKILLLFAASFLVAGIFFIVFNTEKSNFIETVERAENNIENFEKNFQKTSLNFPLKFSKNNSLSLFLFHEEDLIFWNNSAVNPEGKLNKIDEDGTLLRFKNGYYIAYKKVSNDTTLVGMQLVKNEYNFQNRYLFNNYSSFFPFDKSVKIVFPNFPAGQEVRNPQGKTLFKVIFEQQSSKDSLPKATFISSFTFILLYVFAFIITIYTQKKSGKTAGLVAAVIALFCIKICLQFIPFEFLKTPLFSPELYASAWLGKSLGNLLINNINFFSIVVYVVFFYDSLKSRLKNVNNGFLTTIFIAINIYYIMVLKSLILDSTISFEINNFTLLNEYTFYGLIVISLLNSIYFLWLNLYLNERKKTNEKVYFFIIVALVSTTIFWWQSSSSEVSFVALFSLIGFFFLYNFLSSRKPKTGLYAYLLSTLFFSAILSASIMEYFNHIKSDSNKLVEAKKIAQKRDFIAEFKFDELYSEITSDPFVKKFFSSPFISNKELNQRLQFLYFDGHLSKYNIEGVAFNADGLPIKNVVQDSLQHYYDLINKTSENTFSEELFFLPKNENNLDYLSILSIENNGKFAGSLVIKFIPKTYQNDNFYPELLIEEKQKPIIDRYAEQLDYGVYTNGVLSSQSGEYPYPYNLEFEYDSVKDYSIYKAHDYKHLIYSEDDKTVVVVSSPKESIIMPISIFSYLFCFYLIVAITGVLLLTIFSKIITSKSSDSLLQVSFRNRINFAMILIIISSFIIIGIITVRYFSNEYDNYHSQRLIRKQKSVLSAMEYLIQENTLDKQSDLNSLLRFDLSSEIAALSDIHSMDINIFDLSGDLLISSQPSIFSNGLISRKINPKAYFTLKNKEVERYSQEEKIGVLNYLAIYVPIRNTKGEEIAYLNLPYFSKAENMRSEISEFMVALVNVYVFLLVIAGFVAFFVSNSVTSPLAEISNKLRQVNLSQKNEPIRWNTKDEIGALVDEYNRMISQLEKSARLLARSERESAWREMARQIAHEIKNPLTPMKLSIQHLQRAVSNDPERAQELIPKVSKTLVEQIENLSEIATAFSSFAKMPSANKEVVDLRDVLESVVNLFRERPSASIKKNFTLESAIVYADKNQMISVFNNLVKNALQATEETTDAKVVVTLLKEDDYYKVEISDNGTGIAEDKKDKVFVPNFTTKSSGTGLGLAISKQIIENSMGSIWFNSIEGKGTTFFILLPLYEENNT